MYKGQYIPEDATPNIDDWSKKNVIQSNTITSHRITFIDFSGEEPKVHDTKQKALDGTIEKMLMFGYDPYKLQYEDTAMAILDPIKNKKIEDYIAANYIKPMLDKEVYLSQEDFINKLFARLRADGWDVDEKTQTINLMPEIERIPLWNAKGQTS